jgi:hypothetical protein
MSSPATDKKSPDMKLLSQYLTIPLLLCLIGTAQAQDTTALKKLTTVTLTTSVKRKMEQLPGNVTIIPVAPYYATNQTALDLFRRSTEAIPIFLSMASPVSRLSFLLTASRWTIWAAHRA